MRISDWSSDVCSSDLFAVNRGIPAIAVSYAGVAGRSYTTLADGAPEYRIAALVVKLVAQLEANKGSDGRLLPPGIGLNVTIPEIGRASCRERVCQYEYISVVAGSFKKKHQKTY